uniref:Uncharacterized protein n=1 Tax=Utricularia reniformis TaxID=192314 RepID=A0A1Y0B2L7_9LAMI|nr:hypothetical protein AEK19_MT1419 [Utricularia reniformis]ART31613.1 hypothetical protein AEK19_MT1419 [Utricularia reniformis]
MIRNEFPLIQLKKEQGLDFLFVALTFACSLKSDQCSGENSLFLMRVFLLITRLLSNNSYAEGKESRIGYSHAWDVFLLCTLMPRIICYLSFTSLLSAFFFKRPKGFIRDCSPLVSRSPPLRTLIGVQAPRQ